MLGKVGACEPALDESGSVVAHDDLVSVLVSHLGALQEEERLSGNGKKRLTNAYVYL